MNRTVMAMIGSLLVVAGLVSLLRQHQYGPVIRPQPDSTAGAKGAAEGTKPSIVIYCAASNRAVMEAVRKDYEKEYGVSIDVQYGPSQTLLSTAEVARTGDLYLPADDSYLEMAAKKKLVQEILPLAQMTAVICVVKGNPKGIKTFQDLLRDDVSLVQANPDAAAIASITRTVLTERGLWNTLDARTSAYATTVQDVANQVKVGAADAGIVYDAVLTTYPELEPVPIPELDPVSGNIAVGVLSFSQQPTRALHFARYLAARDKGLVRYAEYGFRPVEGDVWVDVPELTVYFGSMMRPAVEQTVQEFEQREGVRVTRVYNGCGILVGQMKAGQIPDAYMACDQEFMNQVQDLFGTPATIAQNELVILVHKGNPFGITSLRDLTKPGLRVGIGHENQCAMGWLTQRTFKEGGIQTEVMANVVVQVPAGDMLVNQMQAGALDAAVVYLSNAAVAGDQFDAVRIKDISCSIANQPVAVARNSKYRYLTERLTERLKSAESRERFERAGFVWEWPGEKDGE